LGSNNTVFVTENFVADGASSKGWEFEAFGNLTPKLSLVASCAFVQKAEEPDPSTPDPDDARPLRFLPDWNVNAFARYNFSTDGRGWAIRAGVRLLGPMPAYSLGGSVGDVPLNETQMNIDVGAGYAWSRYRVDLQVNNILNDTYLVVRINPPRQWRLAVSATY
jgi:outer membrane receptor protein involved in Fe transport